MQPLSPEGNKKEKQDLRKLKKLDKENIRIGLFYSKLNTHQKQRFTRIVRSISSHLGLHQQKYPNEMILIRQIAMDTIHIEEADRMLIEDIDKKERENIRKWAIALRKERNSAQSLLYTLTKVSEKSNKVDNFASLRDTLRELENLPQSKNRDYQPDGHDRRYYDKITRTKS